ncbi:glycinin G4-like [Gastrolobium bilobum]|uniref:glycinin G4-like n=1 Tax=Gastrolobium bilobum TaxID=150636 RepID=UPI002AAFB3CA|nr:glycinin G4-like [Gastrolobium bilobum]XP_061375306.1 glycinin G4-like [Gastrolobium bilobum]
MAKPFLLSLSLCFLFFTSSCFALFHKLNECQLDKINALEPDNRVESEGGSIETWSSKHRELQCAGVVVVKRTLNPRGLHLPSYTPAPQLVLIAEGEGAIGITIPGCSETYEEAHSQSGQGRRKIQLDRHQKIRHFKQGDIIAIPPGIPYWSYNYGDRRVVAIALIDTNNFANQLDAIPRVFYLAGNPDTQLPGTQGKQQGKEQEEEDEGGNVLSGFPKRFLAQALSVEEEIADKLQSPDEEKKQIVKVREGLSVVSPTWKEGQEEEEEEEEGEEDEPRSRKHRRPRGGQEEEEVEEEERETVTREHRQRRRPRKEEEEEEEEQQEQGGRGKGKGNSNGLEESICTLKLVENIARPSRADLYNPRAGRISTLDSLTLPVLRFLRLSAQYVVLYKNGIYAPHWNINANGVMYVTRGSGKVRVVNCLGNSVFNGVLKRGQLLVVPQNFLVSQQAEEEGFEYVVFKTNDRATSSHVKQVFRSIPAEVLANAFGLEQSQVSQLKFNGNRGPLVHPGSQPRSIPRSLPY